MGHWSSKFQFGFMGRSHSPLHTFTKFPGIHKKLHQHRPQTAQVSKKITCQLCVMRIGFFGSRVWVCAASCP